MSNANTTTTTAGSVVATLVDKTPGRWVPLSGLFDVRMTGLHRLELIPRNQLARDLLATWADRQAVITTTYSGVDNFREGPDGLRALDVEFQPRPSLHPGGPNPWGWLYRHNGNLSPDEFTACEALVKEMREKKRERPTTPKTQPRKKRVGR